MDDSEKENFDPDKIKWDKEDIKKLNEFLEGFKEDRNQEMLLSVAKTILEKRIKQIHETRTPDDEDGFWKNLTKLPFNLKDRKRNTESARTWLGLLITGIGIVLFWRGIWDGSEYFLSTLGSTVVGAIILIIMAILGKRQVFKIFGGE